MDTAEDMLRRAARAILKKGDEAFKERIAALEAQLRQMERREEELVQRGQIIAERMNKLKAWMGKHAPHDPALRCSLEYLAMGKHELVNPFARWNLPTP